MLISNHVLAGALTGAALRRPLPALLAGLASHYAMDVTPHWGTLVAGSTPEPPGRPLPPESLRVAKVDGSWGLLEVAAVAGAVLRAAPGGRPGTRGTAVLAGVVGACLPDLDKVGVHFVGRSPWPAPVDAWHARIQVGHEAPHRLPQEVVTVALLACLAAAVLRRG